jgi:hypothetical protein
VLSGQDLICALTPLLISDGSSRTGVESTTGSSLYNRMVMISIRSRTIYLKQWCIGYITHIACSCLVRLSLWSTCSFISVSSLISIRPVSSFMDQTSLLCTLYYSTICHSAWVSPSRLVRLALHLAPLCLQTSICSGGANIPDPTPSRNPLIHDYPMSHYPKNFVGVAGKIVGTSKTGPRGRKLVGRH